MSESESPPAWAVALADQRMALMRNALTPESVRGYQVITTMLTEPPEDEQTPAHFERWQRVCDNCGVFVPINRSFYTGMIQRELYGKQVVLVFGACVRCGRVP